MNVKPTQFVKIKRKESAVQLWPLVVSVEAGRLAWQPGQTAAGHGRCGHRTCWEMIKSYKHSHLHSHIHKKILSHSVISVITYKQLEDMGSGFRGTRNMLKDEQTLSTFTLCYFCGPNKQLENTRGSGAWPQNMLRDDGIMFIFTLYFYIILWSGTNSC